MNESSNVGVTLATEVVRGSKVSEESAMKSFYNIECVGSDGTTKWVESFGNLVVDEGLDEILDKTFLASGYTAAWFVGLADGTPTPAAGDTMASHAGWAEVTDYTEGTREALVLGAVSGQSVDNTASKASFSINATATAGGAFIATNSTKGGSTGTLYSIGAFSGDKPLTNGDTLNVTVTLTTAAS